MHRFKRLITAIFLTLLSIILLFSAAFVYFIVTPVGGKILVRYFKQGFSSIGLMHVGHFEGSLQNGFVLKNISITGLSYLPGAVLRIQEIHIRLPLDDLPHSDLDIFNARIFISGSDPIVFTGRVSGGRIKGNLYANSVDIHEVSRFWTSEDLKKNLRGYLSGIDFTIQGPLVSPMISGHFLIDNVRYKSIFLTDGFSHLSLTLTPLKDQVQVKGAVTLDSGLLNVRKVNLELTSSTFNFVGDIFNPIIDIHMGAKVEDMDFHLTIKGTSVNPQLTITSDPPMAPQEALMVLFTGNDFSTDTASPFTGVTSSELAQDFLNYSLPNYNEDQRFGVKKKLYGNLKLGVQMEEMPTIPGDPTIYYSRKIEGEMDMSEHTSLNVSKEILSEDRDPSQTLPDSQPEGDTEIYVQYKKRF